MAVTGPLCHVPAHGEGQGGQHRQGRGAQLPSRAPPATWSAQIGGQSFRRFGFVQSSIVSRWAEIVGERYAKVSSPESIRFPAGKKAAGVLTLLVEGAHAPMMQHLTPMIVERVNRFFGYRGDRPGRLSPGEAAGAGARTPSGRSCAPVPKELGEGLREIADPELRACLESLAAQIAASGGPPSLPDRAEAPIPVINRSR